MKILLNDNLNPELCKHLPGYEVRTVCQMDWSGLSEQELLNRAQEKFDVFITLDSNALYQKHVANCKIPILALKARSNHFDDTKPLMQKVLDVLPSIQSWKIMVIS